jgi:hypothetical protein
VESCRIGAENESSLIQAQQGGWVFQTFAFSALLAATLRRLLSDRA